MINVDIWKVTQFRDQARLERLNEHIRIHTSFQAHQIATATGCKLDVALHILSLAVIAGALKETTIFYNRHTNEAIYIGDVEKLEIQDEDTDTTLEESDLYWEPYYFTSQEARSTGWQFIKSK